MAPANLNRRRIGSLDTIEIAGAAGGPVVILLHGFGADCSDLASLAQQLQGPKGTTWIFPNGHLGVPIGPQMEGRAWFPIALADLERTMASGNPLDFSHLQPPGLKRARELIFEMIAKLNVPMSRIVLGGFSQGAMLATDVALRSPESLAGLALMSGTLVNAAEWSMLAAEKPGAHFFQCHGIQDPVLPYAAAQKLEKLFHDAKWNGRLLSFRGGHEIPFEAIAQMGAYIRHCFSK